MKSRMLLSFFGVGRVPVAPGTAGAAVALAVWLVLQRCMEDPLLAAVCAGLGVALGALTVKVVALRPASSSLVMVPGSVPNHTSTQTSEPELAGGFVQLKSTSPAGDGMKRCRRSIT